MIWFLIAEALRSIRSSLWLLYTKQQPMPKPYNAQLPILSDCMGKMKLGKALSRQSRVLSSEKKKILCITASPSTTMILIIARQQVLNGNLLEKE